MATTVYNSSHIFKTIRLVDTGGAGTGVTLAAFTAVGDGLTLTYSSVTGAAVGDIALASFEGMPDDIAVTATVTAADTVKVVLINGSTTAALDLADTMDLVITVFQTAGAV